MKRFFTSLMAGALAACVCAPMVAQTTVDKMHVHLKDGTTQTLNLSTIKEITFGSEAAAQNFQVDITGPYEYYAGYTVTPADPDMTYMVMYLEKAEFDKYATDDEVVKDDLKYYQEMADGWGCTLQEMLEGFLVQDTYSELLMELQPGVEYVVWAYGLTPDGKQTTPLTKATFTTPQVKFIQEQPALAVQTEGTDVTLHVTPDTDSRRYVTSIIAKRYVGSTDVLRQKAQEALMVQASEFLYNGEEEQQVLDYVTWTGGQHSVQFSGLEANTDYYVMTGYVSDHFAIISPVSYELVTTGSATSAAAAKPAPAAIQYRLPLDSNWRSRMHLKLPPVVLRR